MESFVCASRWLFILRLIRDLGMAACDRLPRAGMSGSSVMEVEEESERAHVGRVDDPYGYPVKASSISI